MNKVIRWTWYQEKPVQVEVIEIDPFNSDSKHKYTIFKDVKSGRELFVPGVGDCFLSLDRCLKVKLRMEREYLKTKIREVDIQKRYLKYIEKQVEKYTKKKHVSHN